MADQPRRRRRAAGRPLHDGVLRALADAFTICDNYFSSTMAPTECNRLMLFTGTIDPHGEQGAPSLDDGGGNYTWTSYAERLQAAGVTRKMYQQADNYDCNDLEYLVQFDNAPADSPLAIYGTGVSTLYNGQPASDPTQASEEDAKAGNLPTVSWIIPTSTDSEHPAFLPAAGASFVASKLAAIASNPDMWESTVFILNDDEMTAFSTTSRRSRRRRARPTNGGRPSPTRAGRRAPTCRSAPGFACRP